MREVALALLDHLALLHDVGEPVREPGRGRQPVAARAAGLLVVALDRLRQVEVRDEAHVGLVDAHAERDRGDHDDAVLAQEAGLVRGARPAVEPGVVGQRGEALAGEELGGPVHRRAREAVDDAGVAGVLGAQQREQLAPRLVLGRDAVLDVRAVEARDEVTRVAELEARRDLGLRGLRGRRREGDARHRGPALVQLREHEVVGPEVVAPLRHAVRLVDREQRDRAAVEQAQRRLDAQPLGREVEQVQLPGEEGRLDGAALLGVLRGVEESRADAQREQRVDLILHQRDQRRDDDADAIARTSAGIW